eukprot:728656_1
MEHSRCLGRAFPERMSYKYRFHPCFNVLFVIERAFGTVCAFNLDEAAKKHDSTILKESAFYYNLNELLDGWLVLADKAYANETLIAAGLKRNNSHRKSFSKSFWKCFNTARGDSEQSFAHFFVNKFTILAHWPGKAHDTFTDWALNVTCCIIIYNYFKKKCSS